MQTRLCDQLATSCTRPTVLFYHPEILLLVIRSDGVKWASEAGTVSHLRLQRQSQKATSSPNQAANEARASSPLTERPTKKGLHVPVTENSPKKQRLGNAVPLHKRSPSKAPLKHPESPSCLCFTLRYEWPRITRHLRKASNMKEKRKSPRTEGCGSHIMSRRKLQKSCY